MRTWTVGHVLFLVSVVFALIVMLWAFGLMPFDLPVLAAGLKDGVGGAQHALRFGLRDGVGPELVLASGALRDAPAGARVRRRPCW